MNKTQLPRFARLEVRLTHAATHASTNKWLCQKILLYALQGPLESNTILRKTEKLFVDEVIGSGTLIPVPSDKPAQ